jgi:hypothetical protein
MPRSCYLAALARDIAKADRLGRAACEAGKPVTDNPWPCEASSLAGLTEARVGLAWRDAWHRANRKALRKAKQRRKRQARHTRHVKGSRLTSQRST